MNRRRGALIGGALAVAAISAGALTATALGVFDGSPATRPPQFVEESAAAGLDHRYEGDFQYYVGGGVAAFDCDDDGRQDLYFAGGSAPAALFRNESPIGGALHLERVTDSATDLDAVTGAYPLDVDGDGITDLAVLRIGESVLLRGQGDCRFERANESLGFDGGDGWTVAFAATWEGENALATLALGRYVTLDENGDATYTCPPNDLLRPDGSGTRYAPPALLTPGWCSLSMLFSDWSRSGKRDLRISNDRHYYTEASGGEEQLWRVAPGEVPHEYGRDDGWQPLRIWGMGIASQDVTGDGLPEVYLTSQADNKLQTLADGPARPTYRDIALARGAIATRPFIGDTTLPSTAWHAEFQDVNNDGYMDLFVAKGNIEAQLDYAMRDPSNLMLGQADGTFVEAADRAGSLTFARARGAALVDLNLDGLLDLVQVNRRQNVSLFRNVGQGTAEAPVAMGNWAGVQLSQRGPNRDAIGAWVEVRAGNRLTSREVTVGGGHAGGQLGPIHFGLGEAASAEVRVTWPDGEVGPWLPLPINDYATIERGAAQPVPRATPGG